MSNFSGILPTLLFYLGCFSVVSIIATIILLPGFIASLPADFFTRCMSQECQSGNKKNASTLIRLILRNLLGILLLFSGILMLFLPGQGVLTIFISLIFLSFPGKNKVILFIVSKDKIRQTLNWLRSKKHREPFHWP